MTEQPGQNGPGQPTLYYQEDLELSLGDLSACCHLSVTVLTEMVQEGVLEPHGGAPEDWRFPQTALARLQRALRLQHDLGLNMPGVALALDLLEENRALRQRLERLNYLLREY